MAMLRKTLMTTALIAVWSPLGAAENICTMRFGLTNESLVFDPAATNDYAQSTFVAHHLTLTLLSGRVSGQVYNLGAEKITFDFEEKTALINLDQSCRWSDGEPITAQNYIDGITYAIETGAFGQLPTIRTQLENDNTETLVLSAVSPTQLKAGYVGSNQVFKQFLGTNAFGPVPSHTGLSAAEYFALPLQNRVVSGPYQADTAVGNTTTLVPNPYYCTGKAPQINNVDLIQFDTDEERARAFTQHDIDVMRNAPRKQLQAIKQRQQETQLSYLPIGDLGLKQLVVNPARQNLIDPRVREAISLALDYQAFLDAGTIDPTETRISPTGYIIHIGDAENPYVVENPSAQMHLSRARELMIESGYSVDNPFKTNMTTYPLASYETSARMITSMLHQAYFDVNFVPQESVRLGMDALSSADYDLFFTGAVLNFADMGEWLDYLNTVIYQPIFAQDGSSALIEGHDLGLSTLAARFSDIGATVNTLDDPDLRLTAIFEAEQLIGEANINIPVYGLIRNLITRTDFIPIPTGFETTAGFSAQYWHNTTCDG